jgi:hypothetical protein
MVISTSGSSWWNRINVQEAADAGFRAEHGVVVVSDIRDVIDSALDIRREVGHEVQEAYAAVGSTM